ncbi:hypothetical protein ElyMa_004369200 [Elysia marginata]|uniref:BRCA2 OB3 domain-containing protein n=1 Tax=Elysia marginata TaxID=1093978 RepID=A0AAV4H561_9GAST|nr:hypothetical protein ElyMa_004369200 [Elysia marginata]
MCILFKGKCGKPLNRAEVWAVSDLRTSHPKGDEFDFVGLLVKVKEAHKLGHPTVLYFCDAEKEVLAVNIWPGRQSPVSSSVLPGQVLCMSSLFLRQAHEGGIPDRSSRDSRETLTPSKSLKF